MGFVDFGLSYLFGLKTIVKSHIEAHTDMHMHYYEYGKSRSKFFAAVGSAMIRLFLSRENGHQKTICF
jgi:hypothetical protein